MLVCVSANPAIDRRLQLESIAVGGVNRACGTANCLADSPGMVDPLEVERVFPQVSVEPLQTDWRAVKAGGGAR
jgi:hypothetical protein